MTKAYIPNVMLDSGAFSAWYHQDTIDIQDYIAFIREHGERFYSIVCLDKIPGQKAKMAKTQGEIEVAARESHRNYGIMRKAGIESIPVFHQGEDFKWLERMLDDQVPYIGLSPYMKSKQDDIAAFLDKCFSRLCDADGRPICKTHGFGVTGHAIVRRYPWFSVDSTSWALSAGMGNVLMPQAGYKGWDFTFPIPFSISERDTAGNNSMVAQHSAGAIRAAAERYFAELGLTYSEVRNFQEARLIVNASYFLGLEKQLICAPFPSRLRLRGIKPHKPYDRPIPFTYKPKVILATMVKIQQQGVVLTNLRAPYRLISYYDARRFEPERIEEYTTKGFCGRGAYSYARGTKSHDLRRRMLFLKRLNLLKGETDE